MDPDRKVSSSGRPERPNNLDDYLEELKGPMKSNEVFWVFESIC